VTCIRYTGEMSVQQVPYHCNLGKIDSVQICCLLALRCEYYMLAYIFSWSIVNMLFIRNRFQSLTVIENV